MALWGTRARLRITGRPVVCETRKCPLAICTTNLEPALALIPQQLPESRRAGWRDMLCGIEHLEDNWHTAFSPFVVISCTPTAPSRLLPTTPP
eukprot:5789287-Alexandrium_andersonii.AAC.1